MERASETAKVQQGILDGKVDETDIRTMIFDILSSRKKFVYDAKERLTFYIGFLGPVFKFCAVDASTISK